MRIFHNVESDFALESYVIIHDLFIKEGDTHSDDDQRRDDEI